LGGFRGTDEKAFLGVNHIWQREGIGNRGRNIDDSSDIRAAMTHIDTHPGPSAETSFSGGYTLFLESFHNKKSGRRIPAKNMRGKGALPEGGSLLPEPTTATIAPETQADQPKSMSAGKKVGVDFRGDIPSTPENSQSDPPPLHRLLSSALRL
jgi:hypothetical protein